MVASSIFMMLGLVVGADDGSKDTADKEFKKFEGEWIPVCIRQGLKIRAPDFPIILHIKEAAIKLEPGRGNQAEPARVFTMKAEVKMRTGGDEQPLGVLSINPFKQPKTFDLTINELAGLGGTVLQGIYQWDGDVLKLGLNDPFFGGDRPDKFSWVAVLTRDSKAEREAIQEFAKILPLGNGVKDQCQNIIQAHPRTAAAMMAQDFLDHGLVSEQELQELKGAAALIELAKKAPMDKARRAYLDLLKKYPGTNAAKEASRMLIEIDQPMAAKELNETKVLLKDGKKQEAKHDLQKIIESYPETPAAKEAASLVDELEASSILEQAHDLANQNFKEKACQTCEEILRKHPETAAAGEAKELIGGFKLEMARKLADDGFRLKAGQVCKEIIKRFPQTAAANKSQELLAELTKDVEATWKLNLARLMAVDALKLNREDLKEKALARCQEIIEKHPGTRAAGEAKRLQDKLSK
jgi:outer membrane protein assembly factor BamD (BamD/ComL family)